MDTLPRSSPAHTPTPERCHARSLKTSTFHVVTGKSLEFEYYLRQILRRSLSTTPRSFSPPSSVFFLISLERVPIRPLSLELSDTKDYEPWIRACHRLNGRQIDPPPTLHWFGVLYSFRFLEVCSSEYGTYKTVEARFWTWLLGNSSELFPLRSDAV